MLVVITDEMVDKGGKKIKYIICYPKKKKSSCCIRLCSLDNKSAVIFVITLLVKARCNNSEHPVEHNYN